MEEEEEDLLTAIGLLPVTVVILHAYKI